ncbi:hypothetical protein [Aquimarina algicola]|uniref:Uncharacterized protein n=1 Tax=Aquimarina algicola TaxID=2589995 RepID=A0A504IT95_9FLAO|nr:hypothetical protein [Aquimarina algicola]TPN81214.1 hypothetical protein FHK87_24840 [Aquimarina algicola]
MNKSIKSKLGYVVAFLAAGIYFFFQTGDNPFQGPGEKGEIISIEQFEALRKETSSDGKRIAFIGHASVGSHDITYTIGAPLELIFSTPDDDYIAHIPFPLDQDGKNSCYLPSTFTPEDLVLYDNEGKVYPYNEDVVVSFTLERIKNAIPEKNPETGEYSWRYKQVRIDPSK